MRYCIVVAGDLDPATDPILADLVSSPGPGRTELTGEIRDQSALVGLISRLSRTQREVIAVTPLPDPDDR